MRVAVVLVTGFAQPAKISNGLAELREKLHSFDLALLESSSWKTPEQEIARRISCAKPDRVILVGHSYGVWRLTKVAWLLPYGVDDFFSADGVSRDRPRMLTIPTNVFRLHSWRQDNSIIKGSPIAIAPPTVHLVDEWVDCKHHQVDEHPAFQAAVLKACTTTE